jgi:hypothetical protein
VAPSAAVLSILQSVESISSLPVEVHADPGLRVPARVQMARGDMRTHLATYNPNLPTADYYLAFEAGFILRLFESPASARALFAGTGEGLAALERLPLTAPLAGVPAAARKQFQSQLHDGLLTQLRSQAIGMRINEWLWNEHPEIRELHRQGMEDEQRQAAQAVSPEIRLLSPAKVWEASTGMSAAVALFTDRLLGLQRFAVPFEAAGVGGRGRELLALWESVGSEPEHDRERVDKWAAALGLSSWYRWVPLT